MDDPSISPDERFEVRSQMWEAAASQWVNSPQLWDRVHRAQVFQFVDDKWSFDSADWESGSSVKLDLRKYPGSHKPVSLIVVVDCEKRTAVVEGLPSVVLEALEALMEKQLVWR